MDPTQPPDYLLIVTAAKTANSQCIDRDLLLETTPTKTRPVWQRKKIGQVFCARRIPGVRQCGLRFGQRKPPPLLRSRGDSIAYGGNTHRRNIREASYGDP